jgi:hypothetical protein
VWRIQLLLEQVVRVRQLYWLLAETVLIPRVSMSQHLVAAVAVLILVV